MHARRHYIKTSPYIVMHTCSVSIGSMSAEPLPRPAWAEPKFSPMCTIIIRSRIFILPDSRSGLAEWQTSAKAYAWTIQPACTIIGSRAAGGGARKNHASEEDHRQGNLTGVEVKLSHLQLYTNFYAGWAWFSRIFAEYRQPGHLRRNHLRAHDIWCAQAMAIFFYIACIEGRNVVDQAMPDSLSFVCALLSKNPQLFQWGEGWWSKVSHVNWSPAVFSSNLGVLRTRDDDSEQI